MSNLWKSFRELTRKSTHVQTKPPVPEPALYSADVSTSFPADHEPNFCLEISGIVDAEVKADHNEERFDHHNNIIVPIPLSTSWSDISLGSLGNISLDEQVDDDVYHQEQKDIDNVVQDVPTPSLSTLQEMRDPAPSIANNWESLFLQLKSQSSQQLQELRVAMKEKDEILIEKDEILVEKEREIEILREASVSDIFEVEYWRCVHDEQQDKFQALYFHTSNLADDMEAMMEVEEKNKGKLKQQELLIKQLNNRVASLVHEDNMEHLAKQQNITTYSISDTASVSSSRDSQNKHSLPELDTASVSSSKYSQDKNSLQELAMDARRQEESHGISRMLNTVDRLGKRDQDAETDSFGK
jgi:hypothetical protein